MFIIATPLFVDGWWCGSGTEHCTPGQVVGDWGRGGGALFFFFFFFFFFIVLSIVATT